ncbi:MAG TPA: thiamine pyrophosphate-binding protein [Bryobacteraceae bacterium]|nr:thiamine pyrophosphate-binding protein [Bryobacteraceae bacterium]
MANHAEAMAQTFAARGVEWAFGLPGGEIVAFIDACRRAGLRFVLTGHESSAAWMAQVVGQMTGTPGLCISTLGPGATNLVTGVANAWLDRAPLVAVTAQIPTRAIDTMTHQRLPLDKLFSSVAKASFCVGENNASEIVSRSMDLAAAPRPGPVHIALASDLAIQEYSGAEGAPSTPQAQESGSNLDEIAARVNAAERPLLLIGLAATRGVRTLIDKLQTPFLVTPKAKGIASEDHPLFAGVASGMAMDKEVVATLRAADLILAVGFDPVECDKTWFADVPLVSLDNASMAEGDYRPLEAIGDLESMLAVLAERIADPKPWPVELLETRRAAVQRTASENTNGLSPLRLIEELRAVFPRDGIATCDVGSHKLVLGQFWRCYEPGTFLMSNGLSGMGFGIPAAIAAQLLAPEKAVLALVGDGGMLMMVHDLALIRELALPLIVVVLVDRSLSLIRVSAERRGFEPYGVDFNPPDFTRIAQSFGIGSQRATSIRAVQACIETALAKRIPFLIEVPIDAREYSNLV